MKIYAVEATEGMMGQPILVKLFDSEEKANAYRDQKHKEEPPLSDYYGLIDGVLYTVRAVEVE